MFKLGTLRLSKENSIVDARNKIRGLAEDLGFDAIKTVRVTTSCSELIRHCMKSFGTVRMKVRLMPFGKGLALCLLFENCADQVALGKARNMFSGAAQVKNDNDGYDLLVMESLPDSQFSPDPAFITHQQERIKGLSEADKLLRVILPGVIAEELKEEGNVATRRHEHVAVLFTDIVGFTSFCDGREPDEVVEHLQEITMTFEKISAKYQIEKIKTIGDAYLAAAGLLTPLENPVLTAVECGLEMIESLRKLSSGWNIRVGIHVGPVIAGIVGLERFSYDLWGDTVNMASRVESNGLPGFVNLSPAAIRHVMGDCIIDHSEKITLKGKGEVEIFRVSGIRRMELKAAPLKAAE